MADILVQVGSRERHDQGTLGIQASKTIDRAVAFASMQSDEQVARFAAILLPYDDAAA